MSFLFPHGVCDLGHLCAGGQAIDGIISKSCRPRNGSSPVRLTRALAAQNKTAITFPPSGLEAYVYGDRRQMDHARNINISPQRLKSKCGLRVSSFLTPIHPAQGHPLASTLLAFLVANLLDLVGQEAQTGFVPPFRVTPGLGRRLWWHAVARGGSSKAFQQLHRICIECFSANRRALLLGATLFSRRPLLQLRGQARQRRLLQQQNR
jgi:hypothetical protein